MVDDVHDETGHHGGDVERVGQAERRGFVKHVVLERVGGGGLGDVPQRVDMEDDLVEHPHSSRHSRQLRMQPQALERCLVDWLVPDPMEDRDDGRGPACSVLGQQDLEPVEIVPRLHPQLTAQEVGQVTARKTDGALGGRQGEGAAGGGEDPKLELAKGQKLKVGWVGSVHLSKRAGEREGHASLVCGGGMLKGTWPVWC
mmetsp:Transcript_27536/g.88937  ORF Transcript_27536/g.88937 Transcript_27536/m.88937 type:complete len:200 (-) Transcript_27536:78-677(-)